MKVNAVVDGVEREVDLDHIAVESVWAEVQVKHAIDDITSVLRDMIDADYDGDATGKEMEMAIDKETNAIIENNLSRVEKMAYAYYDSMYSDWYEILEIPVRKLYDDCKKNLGYKKV